MLFIVKNYFRDLFYSFLQKNYSTPASNILRQTFYHHYGQTVLATGKSVDIVSYKKLPRPFLELINHMLMTEHFKDHMHSL